MPSPIDARKASPKKTPEKQTPEKKVDLGQQLAKKRSQDFAAKIQGWNKAGGGVVQKQNGAVVVEGVASPVKERAKKQNEEEVVDATCDPVEEAVIEKADDGNPPRPKTPRTPGKLTPKPSAVVKAKQEIDFNRGAWVRRRAKPQVEVTEVEEVKHAGTPKKRVVSDGHWRRDRPPKEEKPVNENAATPKPLVIRRSVASVGIKVPPSHQDFVELPQHTGLTKTRPRRQSRSRSGSRSGDGKETTPDFETSGTKVYIKRRRPSRPAGNEEKENRDPGKAGSSPNAPSSIDKSSTATDITIPDDRDTPKQPGPEPRRSSRREDSREHATLPTSARKSPEVDASQPVLSSSRKRSKTLLDEDRHLRTAKSAEAYARRITESLGKNAETLPTGPVPRVYGNRIEGWLANMPDPFTDSRSSSLTPEPLVIPKKKSSPLPRGISETDPAAQLKDSGRRHALPQEVDPDNEIREHKVTTLKRMGARRKSMSPVKRHSNHDVETTQDGPVMSGALPNSSKEDHKPSALNTPPATTRIPTNGRPLSTILSVDTMRAPRTDPHKRYPLSMSDDATTITDASVLSRASDGDSPIRKKSMLRRKSTKHADLLSVLSRDDTHMIVPSRSMRASRRRPEASSLGDIMNELSSDELKYQRELRTLVDGVIPVLLQHALAEREASSASRVLSNATSDTKPIVDMGIALERLKTTHKRIPMHEPSELLTWAVAASKVYSEYLRAWRLGFKNIVVNLAPAEQAQHHKRSPAWDDELPRNEEGDLVNGTGERVDVAYLLKRPLVRLKYLAKTFKGINQLHPSANAEDMTARYQQLITDAKKRVNDEQARLEDEAASSIDTTRARDPRSLAPITGVIVDKTRSVRARDYFDMDLTHSSGQQLGCKVEIIYRDDAPSRGKAGDVLFCEISTSGRWLLYPPLPTSLVSARRGERPEELIVMIRGFMPDAQQWREVMSLQADDEQTSIEWAKMLGSSPMPPRLSKKSSFNILRDIQPDAPVQEESKTGLRNTSRSLMDPSPREVEVPLGERATETSQLWDGTEVNSTYTEDEPVQPPRSTTKRHHAVASPIISRDANSGGGYGSPQPTYFYEQSPRDLPSERTPKRPTFGHTRAKSEWTTSSVTTTSSQSYSVWLPSENTASQLSDESSDAEDDQATRRPSTRPGMRRRTSSVPSLDMPTIPKLRATVQPQHHRPESPSSDRDLLPSQKREAERRAEEPASAPAKLQKRRLSFVKPEAEPASNQYRSPPPPPLHSESRPRPLSLGLKSNILPSLTPAFLKKERRPSSPLKHEYAPSSVSDSLSDSDYSDELDGAESDTSGSTVDEVVPVEEEGISTVGTLKGFESYRMRDLKSPPPPAIRPVSQGESCSPSDSASQALCRSPSPGTSAQAKTVACIFSWSDRGSWDSLHPEECQVIVTPGLIEAFDLTQANSVGMVSEDGLPCSPSSKGVKPLVALELTPLVPLRRGTAVDISIRSPPTSNSLIRTSNNVMFRSRCPEECEKLYTLINRARIDNPTYIALQNARGPSGQGGAWADAMERRNAARSSSGPSKSWFSLGSRKSSSYRSKGSRTASIAATESSVGTVNSAFSALRRFSGTSRVFNIAKSTITSRDGTRSSDSDPLSSGAATPVPFDPRLGTPLGISNAKVRLYVRDNPAKWRDMGAGRLTVMLPPRQDPLVAANPRATGMEKRILVYGKSKGETLLDVTLGEMAFERVARTGIAVSVCEETEQIAAKGGVLIAKTTIYMIQMKSERDAAYTFGLVGKLRY